MGKNSKSNEKNTWINSIALAHFLLLCAFSNSSVLSPKKSSEFLPILQCVPPLLKHPLSRIYHFPQPRFVLKKRKSPPPPLPFFFSFFPKIQSSHSKTIFLILNCPPKPFKESPTFLKLQW